MSFNLNPLIATALVSIAPPDSFCHRLKAYHDALFNLDWEYQFTDDPLIYRRGQQAVERAHLLQAEVDPDGSIWMSYPGARRHGAPKPIVRQEAA